MSQLTVYKSPDALCINRIIDVVLNNGTLARACAAEQISVSGFHKWLGNDKKAAMAYSRAVELKADILADETIEIADNDEDSARARNRINARQWLAGKLNRKYGERVDLNVIQTIDIGSTLAEARARMLPGSYQSIATDAQVIDSIDVSGQRALDNQSKFLPANDVPTGDEYPNIFD